MKALRLPCELMRKAKTFIQDGHIDDAIALVPEITTHFMRIENDPLTFCSINEIYDALSPPVFAKVLIERRKRIEEEELNTPIIYTENTLEFINNSIIRNLNNYILQREPTGDHLIFKYIEDFVKVKGVDNLSEDDKEELVKTLISKQNPDGIMLYSFSKDIIDYDCDWVPDRLYRLFVNRIIKRRRLVLKRVKKSIEELGEDDTVNRWYVMSYISNIQNADTRPDSVPLIEFIRTLGGAVKPFNPVKYGFITIDSSKPLIPIRPAENAFLQDPKRCFISGCEGMKNGFIKFDIGDNVHFMPSHLYLDSRIWKKTRQGYLENLVSKVKLTINNDEKSNSVVFDIHNPLYPRKIDFPLRKQPFSSATFEIEGTVKGIDVFRITTLEIFGYFEP